MPIRPRIAASSKRKKLREDRERLVNRWMNRVVHATLSGEFVSQVEQYEAHQTQRDYLFNTLGQIAWGALFPVLSVVAAQLVGAVQAGYFAMAYVITLMFFFLGDFGMRTYQVADQDEMNSFSEYQIQRVASVAVMLVAGYIYSNFHGYDALMVHICLGMLWFRAGDALADVYEGRLQQKDKLYLAGLSQALRCGVGMVGFSLVLLMTRNLAIASWALAITHALSLVMVTIPLAYFETDRSLPLRWPGIIELTKMGWAPMVALLMYNVLDSLPKFAMEGVLSYDNQLYYNALYFPAHAILMISAALYKPQLVRFSASWLAPNRHKMFYTLVLGMGAIIVGISGLMLLGMGTVGIPVMSFMYGIDFEQFRAHAYLMVASGCVCALIDFLYAIIVVVGLQKHITRLYFITFAFALPICLVMIHMAQLTGAVLASIVVMSILLLLIVNELFSLRKRV